MKFGRRIAGFILAAAVAISSLTGQAQAQRVIPGGPNGGSEADYRNFGGFFPSADGATPGSWFNQSVGSFNYGFNGTSWDRLIVAAPGDNNASTDKGLVAASRTSLFNGGSWDRARGNIDTGALITLSAASATQNSADQTNYNGRGVMCTMNLTTFTGTSPTAYMAIQSKDTASGTYTTLTASNSIQLTAAGTIVHIHYPGQSAGGASVYAGSSVLPRTWRVAAVIGGTSPAATGTVGCSVIN
jgi:hypothetical protein